MTTPPSRTTTTTTIAYYGTLALSVNGALSYTRADGLGRVAASVNTSGAVTASQLYSPYGAVRYESGVLPTDLWLHPSAGRCREQAEPLHPRPAQHNPDMPRHLQPLSDTAYRITSDTA